MKLLLLTVLIIAVSGQFGDFNSDGFIDAPECSSCFVQGTQIVCPETPINSDGLPIDCVSTDDSCQPELTAAGFRCPPIYNIGFDLGEGTTVLPRGIPDALIESFSQQQGIDYCCCPTHPRRLNICVVVARALCGNPGFPWKVCVERLTPQPTRFPTTRFPTSRGPTRFPTTRSPTPFPTTRAPTSRAPTRFPTSRAPTRFPTTRAPTSRAPTRFPTTRAPTSRAPTRFPTPAPTPGPTCECIFDPSKSALTGFPKDICEGTNGHRCICEGCDYTFNRRECIEWVQFDILADTFWSREETHLIKGEIHVRNGARLTIEPGSVVLFEDWSVSILLDGPRADKTSTHWSTLVVDAGASIDAQEVSFEGKTRGACNLAGGLVFIGSHGAAYDPNYQTIRAPTHARVEQSILRNVRFVGLGHQANPAPLAIVGSDNLDIELANIYVGGSAGDGVQFWGSNIDVHGITVCNAHRGIVAVGGSNVEIHNHEQVTGFRGFMVEAGSSITGDGSGDVHHNAGVQQGLFWAYSVTQFSNTDTAPRHSHGVSGP